MKTREHRIEAYLAVACAEATIAHPTPHRPHIPHTYLTYLTCLTCPTIRTCVRTYIHTWTRLFLTFPRRKPFVGSRGGFLWQSAPCAVNLSTCGIVCGVCVCVCCVCAVLGFHLEEHFSSFRTDGRQFVDVWKIRCCRSGSTRSRTM